MRNGTGGTSKRRLLASVVLLCGQLLSVVPQDSTSLLRLGILLPARAGFAAQLDAEALAAVLTQRPTLRAAAATAWSAEIFCAADGPADKALASVSAFGCSEFHALSSRFSLPSVAIGTVFSTWAEGLDRLIALSAPPPPRLCARLQTRRRERAGTDRPQGKDGAGHGAVCFFLPAIENVSASWGLWRESSIDDTEVWARGPSEEVTVFVL